MYLNRRVFVMIFCRSGLWLVFYMYWFVCLSSLCHQQAKFCDYGSFWTSKLCFRPHCEMFRVKFSVSAIASHYENTPIEIYRKFLLQTLKIFRQKISDIFHISAHRSLSKCSLLHVRARLGRFDRRKLVFAKKPV